MARVWALLLLALPAAEERAIAYLSREVPAWSRDNHCFSCHNNGDGARALYAARRQGYRVAPEVFSDTAAWLVRPRDWDVNRGDPRFSDNRFSDKKLARIQFSATLAEAFEAGLVRDRKRLIEAATALAAYQQPDGSWQVDQETTVGSPVTWGTTLATHMSRRTLATADARRFAEPIGRAQRWLAAAPAANLVDAAAAVLALGDRRQDGVERILRGQTSDGGWGPHLGTPAEVFDTALALLALASLGGRAEFGQPIARGRQYLVRTQLPSGAWQETTRPAGAQSYAQHISTTGWALLALASTNRKR